MQAAWADPPAGRASPGMPASAATALSALSPADPCQGLFFGREKGGYGGGGGGGVPSAPSWTNLNA